MASAYTLAIRNNNGWEVLLAQKNVIDFRRTLQPTNHVLHLCENPGEYVIPGGEIKSGERPGHAALRIFCRETQINMPASAVIQQYDDSGEDDYFWLLSAEENPWLSLSDDKQLAKKNRYFRERDSAVSIDETGRLISSWSWEYYGELHLLVWTPINEALQKLDHDGPLSTWQEGQYAIVRQAIPAYHNYSLIQIYEGERSFPERIKRALQHLVQNPLITNIQVFQDYDRKHPILLGGSGQIHYVKGREHLKGEKFTRCDPAAQGPVLGHEYFVVALNGQHLILMQKMRYTGKDGHRHTFSSENVYTQANGPAEPADSLPDDTLPPDGPENL